MIVYMLYGNGSLVNVEVCWPQAGDYKRQWTRGLENSPAHFGHFPALENLKTEISSFPECHNSGVYL